MHRARCLAIVAILGLAAGTAGATPVRFGFSGHVNVLSPYNPGNVLLGQVAPGMPVVGHFEFEPGTDTNPAPDRAFFELLATPGAASVRVGNLEFASDEIRVSMSDDRTDSTLGTVDSLTVGRAGGFDSLVWPAFGYVLHVDTYVMAIDDLGADAFGPGDLEAPAPDPSGFGPPDLNGFAGLGIDGCALAGVGTDGRCDPALGPYGFTILVDIEDVFAVPEPAPVALLLFAGARAQALRRRPRSPSTRST